MSSSSRGRGFRNNGYSRSQMELMASVSRSSGIERGGDALKDLKTQEEYRAFIQDKLNVFWRTHHSKLTETEKEVKSRKDKEENILIIFRKLREGLYSSGRKDQFTAEVYETSLFLAILFDSPRQTTTILSHLIPDIYSTLSTPPSCLVVIISLIHHLVAAYPSQVTFRQHLHTLPSSLLPLDSESRVWITSLASNLRSLNYSKFEKLTRPSSFSPLFDVTHKQDHRTSTLHSIDCLHSSADLANRALHVLIDSLRTKAREKSWHVIRSAYRELACHPGSGDTQDWLERSLALSSIIPAACESTALHEWLEKKSREGQVKQKDGAEGRWIICKVR